jgi:ferric-dicitrate binding protein FerR (iron transport regulator)
VKYTAAASILIVVGLGLFARFYTLTIDIPSRETSQHRLPVGSIVCLNAKSSINYHPYWWSFSREIELDGEAFFKVAHNAKKPFIVNTKNLHIELLGTALNVSSYSEEKTIKTTLVKGAVKVIGFNKNGLLPIVLTPNHQAVYNKEKMLLNTIKVNTNEYTAWIQKKIIFNNTPFEELLKRIERTFNVKVINKNNSMKEELFTGEFDNESLAVIFKSLSTSFKFNYEIDEHIITIKP